MEITGVVSSQKKKKNGAHSEDAMFWWWSVSVWVCVCLCGWMCSYELKKTKAKEKASSEQLLFQEGADRHFHFLSLCETWCHQGRQFSVAILCRGLSRRAHS